MAQMPDLNVVCKNCGNEVSPYITECPYCGNRLRKRAPKIERDGTVSEPRKARKARKPTAPRLSRFRSNEIPGIRGDIGARPYATIALVVLSLFGYLLLFPIALIDVAVAGPIDGEWWRVAVSPFLYDEHLVRAGRGDRHRDLRLAAGAPPRALRGAGPLRAVRDGRHRADRGRRRHAARVGGNGAALGLLCAWAVPDLIARRRGEDYDGDLLGTAVFAAVLLLMPLAVPDASAIAGFAGGAAGMLAGLVLARARIA